MKFVFLHVKTIHFLFIGISIHGICKQIRVGIMLYAKLKKALPRSAFLLEQGTGIEPACLGWEPSILPMN